MDGYTKMDEYPQRVTADLVPSSSSLQDSTHVTTHSRTALTQASASLAVPVIAVTTAVSNFVSNEVNISSYQGNNTERYSTHLPEVPTTGYVTEHSRFSTHLPPTAAISAYDPRSYTYNPGGFPLHQRHDVGLNYGTLSQTYMQQQAACKSVTEFHNLDSETYNAALALVESQNKIYTDESGGQYFQLESNATDSASYEVVHLVGSSTQNTGTVHVDKDGYVLEKLGQPEVVKGAAGNILSLDAEGTKNLESDGTGPNILKHDIEVVEKTAEIPDDHLNSSLLHDKSLTVFKTGTIRKEELNSHVTVLNPASENLIEAQVIVDVEASNKEFRELTTGSNEIISKDKETLNMGMKYKDTDVQTEGPALECRFGVLMEELRDTPVGKSLCIRLKPVKCSDILEHNISFDIEVDNDLNVSFIEKSRLSEKTSKYSFHISSLNSIEKAPTSRDNSDNHSLTLKAAEKSSVVKDKPKPVSECVPIIKEEADNKILTRARKRKISLPVKIQAAKQLHKSQSKKAKTNLKTDSKKPNKSKKSKSKLKSSKEEATSNLSDDNENDISEHYEVDKDDDYVETLDKSADDTDIQESTGASMSTNISDGDKTTPEAHAVVKMEQNEKLMNSDNKKQSKKLKKKMKEETGSDNEVNENLKAGDEAVVEGEKKGRKKKSESSGEDTKPKRKYTKRMNFDKAEINYSVRKTESGRRTFVCNICGYESKQTGNVRSHMRARHTEEKPFECDVCHKLFSSQSNLRGHWSIHKEDRPFLCFICGQAFKAKSNLQKHIMRHLGDKRFTCTTCGKQFVTSTDLRRHHRVHSSEKRFLCDLCPKGFKDGTSLSRHMFCHSGLKNHLCTFCGEAFARKDNCLTHMKKHHGHETDTIPPPLKRLEHYVNSPEREGEQDTENTLTETNPDSKSVPVDSVPVDSIIVVETLNSSQVHSVVEPQMVVPFVNKQEAQSYTDLMAVDELTDIKLTQHQQHYETYIPISMQGPSW